jgi:four helix bundle protein
VFSGIDLRSKPDFLAKMTIASKEANETAYWLSLLHDNGYLTDLQFSSLDNDMQRILCKLIAIVKTTKENLEKRK